MNRPDDPNGPLCLAERHTASGVWVCIRPKHRADATSATDRLRRRRGESVNADRHYFIKRGIRKGQTSPLLRSRTKAGK